MEERRFLIQSFRWMVVGFIEMGETSLVKTFFSWSNEP